MTVSLRFISTLLVAAPVIIPQTTQGLISGHVVDWISGNSLAKVRIEIYSANTNLSRSTETDASGFYVLPLLSPGMYQVSAEALGYQRLQVNEVELPVACT